MKEYSGVERSTKVLGVAYFVLGKSGQKGFEDRLLLIVEDTCRGIYTKRLKSVASVFYVHMSFALLFAYI